MKNKLYSKALSFALALLVTTGFTGVLTSAAAENILPVSGAIFSQDVAYPKKLIPLGSAVGIKMYSNGIIIAGHSEVETADGIKTPLDEAGLKAGDILISINGQTLSSGSDLEAIVSTSEGRALSVVYERDARRLTTEITPQKSSIDQKYRIGALVRDSMAGVGTITFVDPESRTFGALGHAICDVDTGKLMPLRIGSIMPAIVTEVKKGATGAPGELRCAFDVKKNIGSLSSNTTQGIFGILNDNSLYGGLEALPVADKSEIQEGTAYIYSTVQGNSSVKYEIEISKIYRGQNSEGKNMLIKVTDPTLIEKTGGIVQGMSGSPIVQNGKIIGAVTHVLVNDPKKGYGIFIENMLNRAYEYSVESTRNVA